MPWRIKKDRWPNGREFWTVENREDRQVRVGPSGQPSKFHSKEIAIAARDEMNGKAAAGPTLIDED